MDAALVTRVRIEGRSASGRVETRRESLMVGPVGQSMAVRESRAAWRAWASRWPRQMLIIRYSNVPAAVRAWARETQRGWRRTEERIRRVSLRQAAKVGHVEEGKGTRQLLGLRQLIIAENTCLGAMWHLARALRAYMTRLAWLGVGLAPAESVQSFSSASRVVRMRERSRAMSASSSA